MFSLHRYLSKLYMLVAKRYKADFLFIEFELNYDLPSKGNDIQGVLTSITNSANTLCKLITYCFEIVT